MHCVFSGSEEKGIPFEEEASEETLLMLLLFRLLELEVERLETELVLEILLEATDVCGSLVRLMDR